MILRDIKKLSGSSLKSYKRHIHKLAKRHGWTKRRRK